MENKTKPLKLSPENEVPGLASNHSNHHKYTKGGQEIEGHDPRGNQALRGGNGSINRERNYSLVWKYFNNAEKNILALTLINCYIACPIGRTFKKPHQLRKELPPLLLYKQKPNENDFLQSGKALV